MKAINLISDGNPQILWLAVIILSIVIEAATLSLISIWFAIGAVLCLICSWLGINFHIQIAIFFVSSFALLFFTFPIAKKYLKVGHTKTNAESLIGEIGIITEQIDNYENKGLVKVSGQIWTAKSNTGEPIKEGDKVEILEIKGVKLIVKKIKGAD